MKNIKTFEDFDSLDRHEDQESDVNTPMKHKKCDSCDCNCEECDCPECDCPECCPIDDINAIRHKRFGYKGPVRPTIGDEIVEERRKSSFKMKKKEKPASDEFKPFRIEDWVAKDGKKKKK